LGGGGGGERWEWGVVRDRCECRGGCGVVRGVGGVGGWEMGAYGVTMVLLLATNGSRMQRSGTLSVSSGSPIY